MSRDDLMVLQQRSLAQVRYRYGDDIAMAVRLLEDEEVVRRLKEG